MKPHDLQSARSGRLASPSLKFHLALICLLMLCGCATSHRLPALGAGDRVQIVAAAVTLMEQEVINRATSEGAAAGAKKGASAGAWALGVVCGPYFLFCAPLGAMVGSLSGGIAGSITGHAEALDAAERGQLETRFKAFSDSHDFETEIQSAVVARAEGEWGLVDRDPDYLIGLQVIALSLAASRGDMISLNLTAHVVVNDMHADPRRRSPTREFTCRAAPAPIGSWTGDDSDFMESSLAECYRFLAERIVISMTGGR